MIMHQLIIDSGVSVLKGMIGFILFWVIGSFAVRKLENSVVSPNFQGVAQAVGHIIQYFCIFLGTVSFCKSIGIDLQGAITSLGLTGFALGLALKDTISNLVAGAFIVMYRPFQLDNYIIITTEKNIIEGKVRSIDFRYTTLQGEKGTVLVPNSILYTNIITIQK